MLARQPKLTLLVDITNLLYRVAAAKSYEPKYSYKPKAFEEITAGTAAEDMVGLCMHTAMQSVTKWFNKLNPDFVIFAFEGGQNWRKEYTKEHDLARQYKATRTLDPAMAHFPEFIAAFKDLVQNYTSVSCLTVPGAEADDAIAAYCQLVGDLGTGEQVVILSGDKDFIQLLKHPHVKLLNPDKGAYRNQVGDKEYEADLEYWLFLKCIRGDSGDNVASAFPRVRETRIREAYEDPYKRINFMKEAWVDERGVKVTVGELFEHNQVLMNLERQPPDIRAVILEHVQAQVGDIKSYSHFHFLRFLTKYKLSVLAKDAKKHVALLANNQLFLKGQKADSSSRAQPAELSDQHSTLLF